MNAKPRERPDRQFATQVEKSRLTHAGLTHICASSSGRGLGTGSRVRFAPLLSRCNRPGAIEPGEDACRLFDIVGLDEGTCGRRPGHR